MDNPVIFQTNSSVGSPTLLPQCLLVVQRSNHPPCYSSHRLSRLSMQTMNAISGKYLSACSLHNPTYVCLTSNKLPWYHGHFTPDLLHCPDFNYALGVAPGAVLTPWDGLSQELSTARAETYSHPMVGGLLVILM